MNRLLAIIDRLFPSVPRGLAATIPGPGVRDHQHPGAGTILIPLVPAAEVVAWSPHPCQAWEFTDTSLDVLVHTWRENSQ